jgi:hypothetical protein
MLRSCCPPSPCGRLSRPRTNTRTPPRPRPSADNAPCRCWPPPARRARGASHVHHDPFDRVGNRLYRYSASSGPSQRPRGHRPRASPAVGASRRLRERLHCCGRPMSARFGAVYSVERLLPPVCFRFTFRSRLHARGRLAVPPGRHVVGTLDLRRAFPRLGRPQLLRAAASAQDRHPSRHGRDVDVLYLLSHGASWRSSDYYGGSAPPPRHQLTTSLPSTKLPDWPEGA